MNFRDPVCRENFKWFGLIAAKISQQSDDMDTQLKTIFQKLLRLWILFLPIIFDRRLAINSGKIWQYLSIKIYQIILL